MMLTETALADKRRESGKDGQGGQTDRNPAGRTAGQSDER